MADDLDGLYSAALADFTDARNALAAKLKKAGDDARAKAVKALSKPTVAAWLVNQLARRHAGKLRELVHAGDALRKAQRKLIAGEGREAFHAAIARQRELV